MATIREIAQQERTAHIMAKALGVGCLVGLLFGVIIGNILLGAAIGSGIPLVIGAALSVIRARRTKARPSAEA